MTERNRPAEADGGPVGREHGAACNLCTHSTAVTIYAQGLAAAQLPPFRGVAPWLRR